MAGCGPKDAPPPESPVAMPAHDGASDAAGADLSAVLSELTQQVRKFGFEKQRVPASLNELVAAGYLSAVPEAPAGRSFTIDPKTMQVVLGK